MTETVRRQVRQTSAVRDAVSAAAAGQAASRKVEGSELISGWSRRGRIRQSALWICITSCPVKTEPMVSLSKCDEFP